MVKKGSKILVLGFLGDAVAGVADSMATRLPSGAAWLSPGESRPLHGVPGVVDQVDEDLLQLLRIAGGRGRSGLKSLSTWIFLVAGYFLPPPGSFQELIDLCLGLGALGGPGKGEEVLPIFLQQRPHPR